MRTSRKYLDPVALSKLGGLELVARLVVEGAVTGLHKSPYQGFSIEFAEHRQYMPGDEIRNIDWKVYAKSDRYYVKKYEEETNLRAYILLDASKSMDFKSNGLSKLEYGCYLTASLSYLMLKQRDSVGLVTFDTQMREYVPPRGTPTHLHAITNVLEETEAGNETAISKVFHELAQRIVRRGLVIIISDLLDEPNEVLTSLKHLRHRKHEVIVFHLLDKAELEFSFDGPIVFRDLETQSTLSTQASALRDEYMNQIKKFISAYEDGCGSSAIDYVQIDTSVPFHSVLFSYLSHRSQTKGKIRY